MCKACSSLQAFAVDPELREIELSSEGVGDRHSRKHLEDLCYSWYRCNGDLRVTSSEESDSNSRTLKVTKRQTEYDAAVKNRKQGEQELRPLEDCWLRCLLYLLAPGGGPPSQAGGQHASTSSSALTASVVGLAQEWAADEEAPMKLLYVLSHRYSEDELRSRGVGALNPADRAAVQLVLGACGQGAELDVVLAPVEREVAVKIGMEDDYGMAWIASDAEAKKQEFQWGSIRASKWHVLEGEAPCFSSIKVAAPEELAQSEDWVKSKWPMDQEAEECTGGMDPMWFSWYRRTCLLLWPRSKRLLVAAAACPPVQLLRLHNMLDAAGAGLPDMPVWSGWKFDPSRGVVEELKRHTQPGAAGEQASDVIESSMPGAAAGAENVFTRCARRQEEDRAARAHWGPQPPATAQQLAAALVDVFAKGYFDVDSNYYLGVEMLLHLAKLVCLVGDAGVGASLLKACAREEHVSPYGTNVQAGLLRMTAHFGWPAVWQPLLGQLIAARPVQRKYDESMRPLSHIQLIREAVQLAEQFPSTADGGTRSRKALDALALGFAKGLSGCLRDSPGRTLLRLLQKYSLTWAEGGLLPIFKVLQGISTAGARLALEMVVEAVLQWYAARAAPFCYNSFYDFAVAKECVKLVEGLGLEAAAGSAACLKLLSRLYSDVAPELPGPPKPWGRQMQRLPCTGPQLCDACDNLQAFVQSDVRQKMELPIAQISGPGANPHLTRLVSQWRTYCGPGLEVQAVRKRGGRTVVELTKFDPERVAAAKRRVQGQQELPALQDCWMRCLFYLLAPGGGPAS
ncbi:hypothetical protein C2E21_2779 [Chlorella sorokiniana]|uniref:Uncharacterized protein n=1 Tax=Chlorella sorokiniana TaxID=3076 RepID=A0A2P6TWQ9_CHLSO|nr:hypothetical protein C2E21_2779 [Chlorella sorokiniana]|eukprot:PRW58499.1 hypothetical protein C2E21_2779 [Chlorella sorokiniana]